MHQPNLFSTEPPHRPPTGGARSEAASLRDPVPIDAALDREPDSNWEPDSSGEPGRESRDMLWLRRLELFLRVVVRLYLGLLLVALPWMHFWDENHFFVLYPRLGALGQSGAVRGLISGLGLLNIWIAASEAIHFRDAER